ncbi:hypothetical protein HPB47_001450 [Ixodes persulcatus]|uniref:Uncharacterized protein n=1 Tax=Ixodes persulcatus TaxID=34615 RepID=A0AC60PNY7_IXOPE|nr:hypothetical protein HPB47_001450 [Ixodes persulcatus]
MKNQADKYIQRPLQGMDGSALQREQLAAQVRERLITDPVLPAPAGVVEATATNLTDCSTPKTSFELPKFFGFEDRQTPESFLERLESFCLITGVTIEDRLCQVVLTTLEKSAKLWWRFAGGFDNWDDFKVSFLAEFAPIDGKRRLKEELKLRMQHPHKNLKQFIYVISEYFDRIGDDVPDIKKVECAVRQMHPQLQDLAAGMELANLKELAKSADVLMKKAWRRLQYKPPPPRTNQVARDVVFEALTATRLESRHPELQSAYLRRTSSQKHRSLEKAL